MNALSKIAQTVGMTFAPETYQAVKGARERDQYKNALADFGNMTSSGDYAGASKAIMHYDPGLGLEAMQIGEQRQMQARDRESQIHTQDLENLYNGAAEMRNMPLEARGAFAQRLSEQFGVPMPQSADDLTDAALDEDLAMLRTHLGMGAPEVVTQDPFTLSEGQVRYDAQGNVIADNPKPEDDGLPWYITDQGVDPRYLQAREAGRSVTNVNLPATAKGETEFQKQRGAAASGRMDSISEAGDAAGSTLADAEMMNTLIDQIDYTGFGSETLLNVQKLGRMVGLDIGDDVPAKEAATRLTAKLGLALKSDLPGPMSDGDRDFLLSIPPNIGTTRAGNKALVFMMMKRAQFAQQMHESLIQADPKSMQEFYEWERQFRSSYPPLFDEGSKRDLLAALSESGS